MVPIVGVASRTLRRPGRHYVLGAPTTWLDYLRFTTLFFGECEPEASRESRKYSPANTAEVISTRSVCWPGSGPQTSKWKKSAKTLDSEPVAKPLRSEPLGASLPVSSVARATGGLS